MDPLTHIGVGRAVVATVDRHEPARRGVAWGAVLRGPWPDVDVGGGGVEGPRRPRLRTVSRGVLTGAIVLLGIKGVLLARALRGSNFSNAPLTAVEAQWGLLTEWQVFERTPTELRAWSISARGGPPAIVMRNAL